MTATYDVTGNIGKVRLLIGDTDITDAVFSDAEISFFLTEEGSRIYGAAALALEAIAASTGRQAKARSIMQFSESTMGAAREIRELAMAMRARETAAYGYAEQDITDFTVADLMINKALRES